MEDHRNPTENDYLLYNLNLYVEYLDASFLAQWSIAGMDFEVKEKKNLES